MNRPEPDSRTLFRPVGQQELDLIKERRYAGFPPRLADQPFFYPVLNEECAIQIARDCNAKYNDPKCGYVTRFRVRTAFIDRYELKTVGAEIHQEYWIPAEALEELNQNIVGQTEVIAEFKG